MYTKWLNVQSAIKSMCNTWRRALLDSVNCCIQKIIFRGKQTIPQKARCTFQKSFRQFIHSKMLRIVNLCSFSSLMVVCMSKIWLSHAPLRLLITSCCASLCQALDMYCSCSLTHAATASWSFCTTERSHFCIP